MRYIKFSVGNELLMDQVSENPFNYDENDLGKITFLTEIRGSPFSQVTFYIQRPRSILSPNSKRPS